VLTGHQTEKNTDSEVGKAKSSQSTGEVATMPRRAVSVSRGSQREVHRGSIKETEWRREASGFVKRGITLSKENGLV